MPVTLAPKVRFGPYWLDTHSGELHADARTIRLQPQPFKVLLMLLERHGDVVEREDLRRAIWPEDTFVDFEHGLNTDIKKLRQALGDDAESPTYIETLPRRGYRFIADMCESSEVPSDAEPLPTSDISNPAPERPHTPTKWLYVTASLLLAMSTFPLAYSASRPLPPRIIGSKQITNTGFQKVPRRSFPCYLGTDGSRIYFQEHRTGDRWYVSQVNVNGGEVSDIPSPSNGPQCLQGMTFDRSKLFLNVFLNTLQMWELPLPAGPPRMLRPDTPWVLATGEGNLLYTRNRDHEMVLADGDWRNARKLFDAPDITSPKLSPDGKFVRFTAITGLQMASRVTFEASLRGGSPRRILRDNDFYGDWTPDGTLYFFQHREGTSTSLWARREKQKWYQREQDPVLLYSGPLQLESPVASIDGKRLFAVGKIRRGELVIYDTKSQTFKAFLGGIPACYVAFSHDGQWVAYVSYPDGSLWRSRVDGSDRLPLTHEPMGVFLPRWSPDDKLILFTDLVGTEHRSTYIVPAQGGEPSLVLSSELEAIDATWSADGTRIAYAGSQGSGVKILDLNTMKSAPVPGSEGISSPRWSPDGKWLIAQQQGAALVLYSFEEQKWQTILKPAFVGWPEWSHDSRYVFAHDVAGHQLIRVDIKSGKAERALGLEEIRWTAFVFEMGGWFGLTPDDQVMILKNTGSEEIYALDLEY